MNYVHGRVLILLQVLFGPLGSVASGALHGSGGFGVVLAVRAVLLMTILISSALTLAKTGLTVAFERDWCAR